MTARVLCFGTDDCNRSLVLREVGYEVDRCRSLIEFRALIRERAHVDAVLITDSSTTARREVVTLTREHSRARLVLFDNAYSHADGDEFDLIVPPLMRPREWVQKIADLIEQSRAPNARSQATREQSVGTSQG